MGFLFKNCKGRVHAFGGSAPSFYSIKPDLRDGLVRRAAVTGAGDTAILIMAVTLDFAEIVQPVTTLDDKRLLYLFGTAWNDVSVSGLMLLGDSSTKGRALATLLRWYNANRVSQRQGPVLVSLGTAGLDAYVVGLSLGQADPENHSQAFIIRLVTADVKP